MDHNNNIKNAQCSGENLFLRATLRIHLKGFLASIARVFAIEEKKILFDY